MLAADLEQPRGKPILIISGAIVRTNIGADAVFDRDMLEALGTETVVTKTPWFDGVTKFSGVRLDESMETVGAEGQAVTATALSGSVANGMAISVGHQAL